MTTYRGQDRIPLPLTGRRIADWGQDWPTSLKHLLGKARFHFNEEHEPLPKPYGIRWKNEKRGTLKLENGKYDYIAYKRAYTMGLSGLRGPKKVPRRKLRREAERL